MALGDFVYPPILNSSQPAYNIEDFLIINFTIPSMVSINNIGSIGITIVNQSNNTSIVKGSFNEETASNLCGDNILYYNFSQCKQLKENVWSIIIEKKYLSDTDYQPGKLYKIQMRFGDKTLWTDTQIYKDITDYNEYRESLTSPPWPEELDIKAKKIINNYALIENQHYSYSTNTKYYTFKQNQASVYVWEKDIKFSEWSSVMLIKPITIPELTIGLPNERGTLADKFKNAPVEVIYVERSLNPLFTGTCVFSQPNENEVEDQYKFFLYENDQLISETDWLTHKTNETNDQYSFDQMLKENTYYSVGYQIKTNNGYISDIKQKSFIIELPDLGKLEGVTLRTEPYSEDGYMNVYLNSSKEIQSNFILSRAAENTNFQKWENLGYITNYLQAGEQLIYQDYTVESGIKYLYALTEEIRYDNYSEYKSPLYEGEEGKLDVSKAKSVDFEYAFLYNKGKQLKLKFNNKMSSFKKSVLASKQDTIGSQYPTILRNGQAYYAEFPITGLISLQMDDNQTFFTLGEEGYYYDDELIIPKDKLQNRNYRESTNTDQSCSPWTSTDLVDDNIFIERKFREKVEEFLNNGESKLYRSPTEGNFIINLLNVSFTPNQTLGRMIYEFNSTAYEIDEVNIKNLEKLDISEDSSQIYKQSIILIAGEEKEYSEANNLKKLEISLTTPEKTAVVLINNEINIINSQVIIINYNNQELKIKCDSNDLIIVEEYTNYTNNQSEKKDKIYINLIQEDTWVSMKSTNNCSVQVLEHSVMRAMQYLLNNPTLNNLSVGFSQIANKYKILNPLGGYYESKSSLKDNPGLATHIYYFIIASAEVDDFNFKGTVNDDKETLFSVTIKRSEEYSVKINKFLSMPMLKTNKSSLSSTTYQYKIIIGIEEV